MHICTYVEDIVPMGYRGGVGESVAARRLRVLTLMPPEAWYVVLVLYSTTLSFFSYIESNESTVLSVG